MMSEATSVAFGVPCWRACLRARETVKSLALPDARRARLRLRHGVAEFVEVDEPVAIDVVASDDALALGQRQICARAPATAG